MGKNPTIYDVSKRAGVSTATVSRVLNNPGKVNADTRKAVETAIQDLEYRPLLEARLRPTRDVRRVCVVAPHFTATSFVQRLRGIAVDFAGRNYELQVYSVNSKEQLEHFVETIEMRGLDGLISLAVPFSTEQIEHLLAQQIEMAMIEHSSPLTNCVLIDDHEGGAMAASCFLSMDRKRLGVVCELSQWDYSIYPIKPRVDGFRNEMKRQGQLFNQDYLYDLRCNVNEVYEAFMKVFASGDYPDAIFATADTMALGVLRAARESGIRVPEDVAIIGFDDIDFAEYEGLTTISQHLDQSGRIAADLVTDRMKDPSRPLQHVHLPLTLIKRKTT